MIKNKKNDFSTLLEEVKTKTKKSKKVVKNKGLNFNTVIETLKNAESETLILNNKEEKSLSILMKDIRLVSLNEIYATLQTRPYEIFKYKKACHNFIKTIFENYEKERNEKIVSFKHEKVKITYFRQSSRFFDHDSLIPSFKYFLDAIVEYGVMSDDDPNVIIDIKPIQKLKGKNEDKILGIRIEKVNQESNHQIDEFNPFIEWGFHKKDHNLNLYKETINPMEMLIKDTDNEY